MPQTNSRSTKSARPRGNTSNHRPTPKKGAKGKPQQQIKPISPETKKDIMGVILVLVGLISMVGFLSGGDGSIPAWFSLRLKQIAGWGGVVLPLVILASGLWVLFRNVQNFPRLSFGRSVGVVLLFLNLLTWFHFFQGGGYPAAAQGLGGGYLGAFFASILGKQLGDAGTVILLIAWAIVAVLFINDMSLPELAEKLKSQPNSKPAAAAVAAKPAPRPGTVTRPTVTSSPEWDEPHELPAGFQTIDTGTDTSKPQPVKSPSANSGTKPATAPSNAPVQTASTQTQKDPEPFKTRPLKNGKPWVLPTIEAILDPATQVTIQTNVDRDRARIIEETLASFGAPGHVVAIHRGPTVTQFGVEPDYIENRAGRTRVRVAKIVALTDDLAMNLSAPSVRIEAPVPGHNYVGLEVPNPEITIVSLREVMESEAFRKVKSSLKLALGKDVAGKPVCADLTGMPHLLIAGSTNSGKSVCVNGILTALLLNNTPQQLRLLLVDPKRVELSGYNYIPHLLAPVVVEPERVTGALQWIIREMDARYHKFAEMGVRNIVEYNRRESEPLPYIVVVIDELADLMMIAPAETEHCITRLAQLARATGIHLIIATQRPSVNVVTGLIKANMPARIAFMVASNIDSRVILDQPGAEKLLGRGDMLYQAADAGSPVRLQGTYVSDSEILRLVETWKTIALDHTEETASDPFANASVEMLADNSPLKQGSLWEMGNGGKPQDPLLNDAIATVRKEGKASISLLQRRLSVGYGRAARMIDTMEELGIIGPQQSASQVRAVLDNGEEDSLDGMGDPPDSEDNH